MLKKFNQALEKLLEEVFPESGGSPINLQFSGSIYDFFVNLNGKYAIRTLYRLLLPFLKEHRELARAFAEPTSETADVEVELRDQSAEVVPSRKRRMTQGANSSSKVQRTKQQGHASSSSDQSEVVINSKIIKQFSIDQGYESSSVFFANHHEITIKGALMLLKLRGDITVRNCPAPSSSSLQ